jgi:hypothetical protein
MLSFAVLVVICGAYGFLHAESGEVLVVDGGARQICTTVEDLHEEEDEKRQAKLLTHPY